MQWVVLAWKVSGVTLDGLVWVVSKVRAEGVAMGEKSVHGESAQVRGRPLQKVLQAVLRLKGGIFPKRARQPTRVVRA